MASPLKKVFRKNDIKSAIQSLEYDLAIKYSVTDIQDQLIYGVDLDKSLERHAINNGENVVGWVYGNKGAISVANMVSYVVRTELEMKGVVRETLDTYKEINLFYNICDQMASCLDAKKIAGLAVTEMGRLLNATSTSIIVQSKEKKMDVINSTEKLPSAKQLFQSCRAIVEDVVDKGRAEIINDLPANIQAEAHISALICAPLKIKNKVLGAFLISSRTKREFSARDLKVVSALSSQTASAIENSLLHRRKIEEERKLHKLQNALSESQMQLEEASRLASIGEIAASIAHEVNNPLGVIIAETQDLIDIEPEDLKDIDGIRNVGKTIEKTAMRISQIVRALKNLSRKNNRNEMVKSSLKQIIDDTLALCQKKFKLAEVELELNVTEDLELICNPVGISQVLVNLFSNAIDAIEELSERWVRLDLKQDEHLIEISVTDSGGGISPDIATKILEPFYTQKAVGKGTGLGLSISKRIIESHQGEFKVDTEHENTRFVFTISKDLKTD